MRQTRLISLIEASANLAAGYGVAAAMQVLVFPLFGLEASLAQNLGIGAAFTGVLIVRSYVLRRMFEAVRISRVERHRIVEDVRNSATRFHLTGSAGRRLIGLSVRSKVSSNLRHVPYAVE